MIVTQTQKLVFPGPYGTGQRESGNPRFEQILVGRKNTVCHTTICGVKLFHFNAFQNIKYSIVYFRPINIFKLAPTNKFFYFIRSVKHQTLSCFHEMILVKVYIKSHKMAAISLITVHCLCAGITGITGIFCSKRSSYCNCLALHFLIVTFLYIIFHWLTLTVTV